MLLQLFEYIAQHFLKREGIVFHELVHQLSEGTGWTRPGAIHYTFNIEHFSFFFPRQAAGTSSLNPDGMNTMIEYMELLSTLTNIEFKPIHHFNHLQHNELNILFIFFDQAACKLSHAIVAPDTNSQQIILKKYIGICPDSLSHQDITEYIKLEALFRVLGLKRPQNWLSILGLNHEQTIMSGTAMTPLLRKTIYNDQLFRERLTQCRTESATPEALKECVSPYISHADLTAVDILAHNGQQEGFQSPYQNSLVPTLFQKTTEKMVSSLKAVFCMTYFKKMVDAYLVPLLYEMDFDTTLISTLKEGVKFLIEAIFLSPFEVVIATLITRGIEFMSAKLSLLLRNTAVGLSEQQSALVFNSVALILNAESLLLTIASLPIHRYTTNFAHQLAVQTIRQLPRVHPEPELIPQPVLNG